MKNIQWFPGHMAKAIRMMEENIRLCDGAVYVLDSRAPYACINRKLLGIFGSKPVLYVLNKSDLTDGSQADKWIDFFTANGKRAVKVCCTDKKSVNNAQKGLAALFSDKINRDKEKGIFKPVRVMVTGIPNTGKSTLINAFSGGKKAVTGDKAGVTKGKQWIRLEGLELMDTPGVMPPGFDTQYLARHLAYIGSINDDILDYTSLSAEFLSEVSEKYPSALAEKYGIDEKGLSGAELLNRVCRKRGFMLKGGELDCERGARAVIDDFRKGRTGKLILERADDQDWQI